MIATNVSTWRKNNNIVFAMLMLELTDRSFRMKSIWL